MANIGKQGIWTISPTAQPGEGKKSHNTFDG